MVLVRREFPVGGEKKGVRKAFRKKKITFYNPTPA